MKRIPMPSLVLLLALTFGSVLSAQSEGEVEPLAQGTSTIDIELNDSTGFVTDFSEAVVVVAWLPANHIPFDEYTQGQWSHRFAEIATHPTVPSDVEMGLVRDAAPLRGKPYNIPPSGRVMLEGFPEFQRLAVACYFDGIWWPLRREIWFNEEGSGETALIPVHAVNHDVGSLEATSYVVDVSEYISSQQLAWHSVQVVEQLSIRNYSQTHAVIGEAVAKDQPWLRFHLTPPPGIEAQELIGDFLISQWGFFVGEKRFDPIPYEAGQSDQLRPYRPWTWGMNWTDVGPTTGDNPHGPMGHGKAAAMREYFMHGKKLSADNAHPLNRDGQFEFLGAGDVSVQFLQDELYLVINKPIPPGHEITIVLSQRPGISFANPQSVRIDRGHFPFPVKDFRVKSTPYYEISGGGGLMLPKLESGTDGLMRTAVGSDTNPALPTFAPMELVIAPTGMLADQLKEADLMLSREEAQAAAQANQSTGSGNEEEGIRLASLMWLAACIFGLSFLMMLVWMVRGNADKQLKVLRPSGSEREAAMRELKRLEEELKAKKVPAGVYLQERARIVDYLIESELSEESEKAAAKEGAKKRKDTSQ